MRKMTVLGHMTGVLGCGIVCVGCWMISTVAGLLAIGSALILLSVALSIEAQERRKVSEADER